MRHWLFKICPFDIKHIPCIPTVYLLAIAHRHIPLVSYLLFSACIRLMTCAKIPKGCCSKIVLLWWCPSSILFYTSHKYTQIPSCWQSKIGMLYYNILVIYMEHNVVMNENRLRENVWCCVGRKPVRLIRLARFQHTHAHTQNTAMYFTYRIYEPNATGTQAARTQSHIFIY